MIGKVEGVQVRTPFRDDDDIECEEDSVLDKVGDLLDTTPQPKLGHIQRMNVNLEMREVFVGGEIDEGFGAWFTIVMRYLESVSHKPIVVWLNTPGGNVRSMFTFHDLVRASPCEIATIGTGQVCSAGVLMLACGNSRYVTESTILMSHRSEETLTGHLEQMEAQMKVVKWEEAHWAALMDRYTPEIGTDGKLRDARHWFQLGKKTAEWWITGGKAIVAEGLADAVYNLAGEGVL